MGEHNMAEINVAAGYGEMRESLTTMLLAANSTALPTLGTPISTRLLRQLLQDLNADFFTVVVLGEFKRGKSTMINALLGQELLPADVTPTTATINALRWGDPGITVQHPDGNATELPLEPGALQRFVADSEFDPATVDYLDITLPAPLLRNRIVLVDTPGVDDLSQARSEVTYRFMPRADAVLFLLDATSPVKMTEKLFLEEHVYKGGVEQLLFIANFIDQVDPEESPDIEAVIRNRLAAATGKRPDQVYLMSAHQALQGRLSGDQTLVRASRITALEEALDRLLTGGNRSQAKLRRYHHRTRALLGLLLSDADQQIALAGTSLAELRRQLEEFRAQIRNKTASLVVVEDYVKDRQGELLAMTRKSLQHFDDNLREHVLTLLDDYRGTEFKQFVETKLPQMVRRALRGWVETHAEAMETLLKRIEQELAAGLAREFSAAIAALYASRSGAPADAGDPAFAAQDVGNVMLTAGVISGGLAIAASLVAGPLIPLIGMVAFPFLQKTMLEHKLTQAKTQARINVTQALDHIMEQFESGVTDGLKQSIAAIQEAATSRFRELMSGFEQRLAAEITVREAGEQQARSRSAALADVRNQLQAMISKLEAFPNSNEEEVPA